MYKMMITNERLIVLNDIFFYILVKVLQNFFCFVLFLNDIEVSYIADRIISLLHSLNIYI